MIDLRAIPKAEARAVLLSLLASLLLMGIKFAAYFLTGSSAIFSDALESIVNVVASLVALYALSLAHAPADADHPYGHGKVEFLSAGFEGGMILSAALVIIWKSVEALIHGVTPTRLGWGFALIAVAMALNLLVGLYLVRVGRRTYSMTLEADGRHLLTDAVTSGGAVMSLTIIFLWPACAIADPLIAIVMALYIGITGVTLTRRSMAGLMDEQDKEDKRLLQSILDAHVVRGDRTAEPRQPAICSYHKLRHRHSGRYHWVDFHIMVPARLTIEQGHAIASEIEYEIEQALKIGNATAHVEPCTDGNCPQCSGK